MIIKEIAEFYERLIIKIANFDRRDRFKKACIFMMGLKKIFSNRIKAFNWFKNSLISADSLILKRDENYYSYIENENYSRYLKSSLDAVLSLGLSKKDKICDFGCGRGHLLRELSQRGYDVIGLDESDLAYEKRVFEKIYKKDIAEFEENYFKAVLLFSVLDHIDKSKLSELLRKLNYACSDWIITSIPVYPDNLKDFYDDLTHRTFERRKWWDDIFLKAGFYPAYIPNGQFDYLNLMVYRKMKFKKEDIWRPGRNIIKTKMSIGDNLCILPALREVKKIYPEIKLIISKDSSYRDIFENNPIFSLEDSAIREGDNIVEFHFPRNLKIHLIDEFAKQAGLFNSSNRGLEMFFSDGDKIEFKLDGYKYLAVDTRAGWISRKWPHINFESVCKILKERYGVKIVEVGKNNWGPGAFKEVEYLKNADLNYVDKLTLKQTAYLISKCGYFLGNDGGLAHISAAVKAKSFVIFGPVESIYREHKNYTISFYDIEKECYGCYTLGLYGESELKFGCPRKHFKCMKKIKAEYVANKIAETMGF